MACGTNRRPFLFLDDTAQFMRIATCTGDRYDRPLSMRLRRTSEGKGLMYPNVFVAAFCVGRLVYDSGFINCGLS